MMTSASAQLTPHLSRQRRQQRKYISAINPVDRETTSPEARSGENEIVIFRV